MCPPTGGTHVPLSAFLLRGFVCLQCSSYLPVRWSVWWEQRWEGWKAVQMTDSLLTKGLVMHTSGHAVVLGLRALNEEVYE